MEERTRLELGLLGAALILGALGDLLLRAMPWGINFSLGVATLVGAATVDAWFGHLRIAPASPPTSSETSLTPTPSYPARTSVGKGRLAQVESQPITRPTLDRNLRRTR